MQRRPLSRLAIAVSVIVVLFAQSVPAIAATWPAGTHQVALSVQRIAGIDRYATSVASARASWPGWTGIDRVIIATGESDALADPLAAGSLCWAYDAPLLLVRHDEIPAVVRTALEEIVAANPLVDVTIVGGAGSVGAGVFDSLSALVAPGVVEQVAGADRYGTAAAVALRSAEVARDTSRTVPARALVANGTTPFGFVDALSLSAVSASTGVPVLLVARDLLPEATESALATLPAGDVIVAGGAGAVSAPIYDLIGGTTRWSGVDRYETSVKVATGARALGWLTGAAVGLASSVPDALTGSISMARMNGPLLVTRQAQLDRSTTSYLTGLSGAVDAATIFGGAGVVSSNQERELLGYPTAPVLYGPPAGSLQAKRARIRVQVGINTTAVQLWLGTTLVATKPAVSYATVDFGDVWLPAAGVALRAVPVNVDGKTSEVSRTFRRLIYPATTSIVIDKSDFRLYFVKGDVLIETYPVAIGRPGMETPTRLWKINSKYITDPNGVYGPRKMRLYAQSGSSWAYTAYGIHGTNEPWVIGTKASHGCIRLYNRDILDLWPQVALGTLVLTRE
ncbi:MAG: cell wall-binding repeat-containing protein [Coriobacteriia bacterium]